MAGSWKDIPVDDVRNILIGLIGHDFGDAPELRVDEIRESRKAYASHFCKLVELKSSDRVVDLGSGCGFGTYWISQQAREVIACDISDAYLQFAAKQCEDRDNIAFNKIQNTDLGFIADETIDKIISMSVFIHMNEYDIFHYFREFSRILKHNGLVCIDFADGDSLNFLKPGEPEKWFKKAAEIYAEKGSDLSGLMNWNSEATIINMAEASGLEKVRRQHDILVLKKTSKHLRP